MTTKQRERLVPTAQPSPPDDLKTMDLPVAFQFKPGRFLISLGVLAFLGYVVWIFATSPNIEWRIFREYFFSQRVLNGVGLTLLLTAIAMVAGTALGVLAAFGKMSDIFGFRLLSNIFLWIFRGTPLLVQVLFIFNLSLFIPVVHFFGAELDTNVLITSMTAAIIALTLHEGAYMAEYIRGGILGVSGGQREAALSQGLTPRQAMFRIVLPQAIPSIIPAIGNQTISMLKGTSIVSLIAAAELLTQVQIIYNINFYIIELLLVACAWYLIMVTIGTIIQNYIEHKFAQKSHQAVGEQRTFRETLRQNLSIFKPIGRA